MGNMLFKYLYTCIEFHFVDVHKGINAMVSTLSKFLKCQSQLQQMTNFATSFLNFGKIRYDILRKVVCQETILIKCHYLFVIFEKNSNM